MLGRLRTAAPSVVAYALVAAAGALALHYFAVVTVAGGSMVPALMPGDVAVVAKRAPVRAGDIALMRPATMHVLHRVTRVGTDGRVWTRGDANPVADLNAVPADAIRGRVVRVVPFGLLFQRWRGQKSCVTLAAQSDSTKR